jgi:hypothetical protein
VNKESIKDNWPRWAFGNNRRPDPIKINNKKLDEKINAGGILLVLRSFNKADISVIPNSVMATIILVSP